MAIGFMSRVYIPEYTGRIKNFCWEYDETLTSVGAGATIIIPVDAKTLVVTLKANSASGFIETTTNTLADVRSDTDIVWSIWDNGLVSTIIQDVASAVTAIRHQNTFGTTRMMLRAYK